MELTIYGLPIDLRNKLNEQGITKISYEQFVKIESTCIQGADDYAEGLSGIQNGQEVVLTDLPSNIKEYWSKQGRTTITYIELSSNTDMEELARNLGR